MVTQYNITLNTKSFHRDPNKRCSLTWNDQPIWLIRSCVWWLRDIFALRLEHIWYVNIVEVILFLYECIRHCILLIRNKGYIAKYGMPFSIRMIQEIILLTNYMFLLSVILSAGSICSFHNCCWLMRQAIMAPTGQIMRHTSCYKSVECVLNAFYVRNTTCGAFILQTLNSQWSNLNIEKVIREKYIYYVIPKEGWKVLSVGWDSGLGETRW